VITESEENDWGSSDDGNERVTREDYSPGMDSRLYF
jgi:hypothetical protein